MLNSDRFLGAYNKLEYYLRKITGEGKGTAFYTLVAKACQAHPEVRHYSNDLKEFADLRNAIVHEHTDGHVIAEPNDKATQCIENIARVITSPPKVIPLFSREVFILGPNDHIDKAVVCMLAKNFSQIPIYDNKQFVALLTTDTIARWLGASVKEDIFSLRETSIERVLPCTEERDNHCFVSRNITVFEALEKFHNYEQNGKRLEAIIITDSGKESESPLGIINVWDLPKIYANIQE